MQTDLHPLWTVQLWVSELPSSQSSSLLQDLGHTVLSLCVAVQETMCHATLDLGDSNAGAQGGLHPCMGPSLQE